MKAAEDIDVVAIVAELLSAAIRGTGPVEMPEMDENQWEYIFGVCAAQNVHTLIYDVLPVNIHDGIHLRWKRITEVVASRNGLIDGVVEKQERSWKKLGLDYLLLKGPALSGLYPVPEHRGCGDVDWCFLNEDSWEKARASAARNAENGLFYDSDGDFHYTFNGAVIEHHRDWTHLSSKKLRKFIGAPAKTDGGRLLPEDTLLMLECHILHHLAFAGIGLKQFADLAVAMVRYDGQYDKRSFEQRMRSLGLERWSALLHSLLVDLTGVDESVLPIPPESSEKDKDAMLEIIFSDGCVPAGRKPTFHNLLLRACLFCRISKIESKARYFSLLKGRIRNNCR